MPGWPRVLGPSRPSAHCVLVAGRPVPTVGSASAESPARPGPIFLLRKKQKRCSVLWSSKPRARLPCFECPPCAPCVAPVVLRLSLRKTPAQGGGSGARVRVPALSRPSSVIPLLLQLCASVSVRPVRERIPSRWFCFGSGFSDFVCAVNASGSIWYTASVLFA